jgi:hypothetical protein
LSTHYRFAADYDYWLRLASIAPPGRLDHYLASFRSTPCTLSRRNYVEQFAEELRIARTHGREHPVALFAHRMNRAKIVIIYRILHLLSTGTSASSPVHDTAHEEEKD